MVQANHTIRPDDFDMKLTRAATAIILAAGRGSRMQSQLPKALHCLHSQPLVFYPLRVACKAKARRIIAVLGYGFAQVQKAINEEFGHQTVHFVKQTEQLGTGHAVLCALKSMTEIHGPTWIINGDVPFLSSHTLRQLHEACIASTVGAAFATTFPAICDGYGRVLRDHSGQVKEIREHKDANEEERRVNECNAGVYCFQADRLREMLPKLGTKNAQKEIYLTDMIEVLAGQGEVKTIVVDPLEVTNINTPKQLQILEAKAPPTH